ncbi:MAG: 3-hydroxyacyl-CoA dehydrogenase NAD-binding domain-containing protein [Syntrophales bacterium]|nr:3-hydroxyacyl-CoA dehydrogenase NAD-binding domain-containing protein [Syntrophales bacterium]HPL63592.1 3-hydroxyacyl-CoA dehydrogenase NAD-binding domain-containing protein [Syntrophales bacterium]
MADIFKLSLEKDGTGVVVFDVPGPMNTWTDAALAGLAEVLEELKAAKGLRGAIFISGKPDNFFAGANLQMIEKIESGGEARKVLDVFHGLFKKLQDIGVPTVAAVHGHCLGGGLEFALAFTARIAREGKTTLIGLPECNVGLFPGGGGTQRLPRLIGYPAIELILKGTMLPAARAHQLGIIDRLVPAGGDLLAEAKKLLEEIISGTAGLKRPAHDFSGIDQAADAARKEVLKATRGRELPAPMLALAAIRDGLKAPLDEGLEIEKKYFTEVVMTPEAKGSINTFFIKTLTDKPKALMTKGFTPKPLRKVAILGFGTMGRGIAIDVLRNTNFPLLVKDVPEALEPGKAFLKKILEGMAEKKRLKESVDAILSRLDLTSEYGSGFGEADLVVEAVFEDIKVKDQVYKELSKAVREDCLIASNTSSIPITKMAGAVLKPERFGGMHFFSPVWMMQLVEVIQGDKTSRETVDGLLNFAGAIRKRPIVCRDNPGFVVNAMILPYLVNALKYVEEGNTIEAVDQAMLSFGMPVGPVRLTDEVGIDVPYKVLVGMGIPQNSLKNIVGDGRLGLKKSGKGIFLKDGSVDPAVLPLIARSGERKRSAGEIQEGILTDMVKVGKDLLDRKIVDDVRMIDVGLVWGVGFPPDKGGPMRWADLTGLSRKLFGKTFYRQ